MGEHYVYGAKNFTVSLDMNSEMTEKEKAIEFSLMVKSQTLELARSECSSLNSAATIEDITTIKD